MDAVRRLSVTLGVTAPTFVERPAPAQQVTASSHDSFYDALSSDVQGVFDDSESSNGGSDGGSDEEISGDESGDEDVFRETGGGELGEEMQKLSIPLVKTDKYGFIVNVPGAAAAGNRTTQVQITAAEQSRRLALEAKRSMKWVDMLRDWEVLSKTRSGKDLIMKRVRKGVPDNVRGKVWSLLGGVPGLIKENPPVGAEGGSRYAEILAKSKTFVPNQDIRDTIERDINRTFPQHALFKDGGQGQDSLRNVLVSYSLYDEEVGYCQGIGFQVAMFLTYMPEEEAFWLLVGVMNREPCAIRTLYIDGMPLAQKSLYTGNKLMKKFYPRLHKHFMAENCDISMYATQWFLTIFSNSFPFDLVTHVWDCFLCEGWKIVYRVALTFVRHAAPRLFKMDFEKLMDFFKNLPSKVDGRLVMERAFDIKLKQRHVNHCYTKYDKLNPDVKAMLEGAEIATEEKRRAGLLGKLEDMEDNVVAEEEVVEEGEEKGEGGESSSDRDLLSKTSA